MLIGHLGTVLSFISFIICIMAYTYTKDAYEVDTFEKRCFYAMAVLSVLNILAWVFKDYSVMYISDFVQILFTVPTLVLTYKVYVALFRSGLPPAEEF